MPKNQITLNDIRNICIRRWPLNGIELTCSFGPSKFSFEKSECFRLEAHGHFIEWPAIQEQLEYTTKQYDERIIMPRITLLINTVSAALDE